MLDLTGLATGIGSLPHQDALDALELVFRYLPNIPFWPQLPKRNPREGMLTQFSENLACLRLKDNALIFDSKDKEQELEKFYEKIIDKDLEYFKISPDFALGLYAFADALSESDLSNIKFIKCHITGPFTFAASIKDENSVALLHDPVYLQAITSGLAMKALWQAKFFEKFNKKIIVFIDEPYLACFGSAYTPVNRDTVLKVLSELTSSLAKEGILCGIHCCGNTDWSIFTEIKTLGIINFDAFGFLDKFVLYASNLKDFLERSGIICWGIAPTHDFSEGQTVEGLVEKLMSGVDTLVKKGLDRSLVLKQLLISPSCGLGSLTPSKAEAILKLLAQTSAVIREKRNI